MVLHNEFLNRETGDPMLASILMIVISAVWGLLTGVMLGQRKHRH